VKNEVVNLVVTVNKFSDLADLEGDLGTPASGARLGKQGEFPRNSGEARDRTCNSGLGFVNREESENGFDHGGDFGGWGGGGGTAVEGRIYPVERVDISQNSDCVTPSTITI